MRINCDELVEFNGKSIHPNYVKVLLNGQELQTCIAVDTDERWIDRLKQVGTTITSEVERIHIGRNSKIELRDIRDNTLIAASR